MLCSEWLILLSFHMQVTSCGFMRCLVCPLTWYPPPKVTWTVPVFLVSTCSSPWSSCCRYCSLSESLGGVHIHLEGLILIFTPLVSFTVLLFIPLLTFHPFPRFLISSPDPDSYLSVRFHRIGEDRPDFLHHQWHWSVWWGDRQPHTVQVSEHHRGPGADWIHLLRQNGHPHWEQDGVSEMLHHGHWVSTQRERWTSSFRHFIQPIWKLGKIEAESYQHIMLINKMLLSTRTFCPEKHPTILFH